MFKSIANAFAIDNIESGAAGWPCPCHQWFQHCNHLDSCTVITKVTEHNTSSSNRSADTTAVTYSSRGEICHDSHLRCGQVAICSRSNFHMQNHTNGLSIFPSTFLYVYCKYLQGRIFENSWNSCATRGTHNTHAAAAAASNHGDY